ncbi:MAG TPA: class I SAM-dependent methyltransferase [Bacteroidales bacterium]|nr:class I SAM-dependent methyltransferase [Bacteroidales bacterium]HRZ49047.1 class I SAM-dependent methyltransferase [Bacteroidales bacterium]
MSISTDISEIQDWIDNLLNHSGPDPHEYGDLLALVSGLKSQDVPAVRALMMPVLTPETIIGFSFTKPMGYNGDFFIIEKIYQEYVNPDPKYSRWDLFFHQLPAARAVVNRKELAIKVLAELNKRPEYRKDVLVLGSGPAREINEYMASTVNNTLWFDLLDLDQRAITYASNRNKAYKDYLTFHHANVIRFNPSNTYDLIWSAGLFDYFKDKHFVYMIRKYYEYLNPGGMMIIGNFSVSNPSRKIMEVLGDWFLYHRSEEQLLKFSQQAHIPENNAWIMTEPLGINLFLTITKDL